MASIISPGASARRSAPTKDLAAALLRLTLVEVPVPVEIVRLTLFARGCAAARLRLRRHDGQYHEQMNEESRNHEQTHGS